MNANAFSGAAGNFRSLRRGYSSVMATIGVVQITVERYRQSSASAASTVRD